MHAASSGVVEYILYICSEQYASERLGASGYVSGMKPVAALWLPTYSTPQLLEYSKSLGHLRSCCLLAARKSHQAFGWMDVDVYTCPTLPWP